MKTKVGFIGFGLIAGALAHALKKVAGIII